jgi:hypothetical protein
MKWMDGTFGNDMHGPHATEADYGGRSLCLPTFMVLKQLINIYIVGFAGTHFLAPEPVHTCISNPFMCSLNPICFFLVGYLFNQTLCI